MSLITTYYRRSVACTRATPACHRSFEGHSRTATPAIMSSYSAPAYRAGNGVLKEASSLTGLDSPVSTTPGLEKLLHDDHAPLRSRPGFFATMFAYAALAAVSAFGYAGKAQGSIIPTTDVPSSVNPSAIYAAPSGGYTGADADPFSNLWVASRPSGQLDFRNMLTENIASSINTGIPGITGVAYTTTPDMLYLTQGTNLILGSIAGNSWNTLSTTGLSYSPLDADVAGNYVIMPTQLNGIQRREISSGNSVQIASGNYQSLEVFEFDSYYSNPMMNAGANLFSNTDNNYVPIGGGVTSNMHHSFNPVTGTAYNHNGAALVNQFTIDYYQPFAFNEHIVPEPSTALLAGVGALALAGMRRRMEKHLIRHDQ